MARAKRLFARIVVLQAAVSVTSPIAMTTVPSSTVANSARVATVAIAALWCAALGVAYPAAKRVASLAAAVACATRSLPRRRGRVAKTTTVGRTELVWDELDWRKDFILASYRYEKRPTILVGR